MNFKQRTYLSTSVSRKSYIRSFHNRQFACAVAIAYPVLGGIFFQSTFVIQACLIPVFFILRAGFEYGADAITSHVSYLWIGWYVCHQLFRCPHARNLFICHDHVDQASIGIRVSLFSRMYLKTRSVYCMESCEKYKKVESCESGRRGPRNEKEIVVETILQCRISSARCLELVRSRYSTLYRNYTSST